MRQFKRDRGYLVFAQNNSTVDYVKIAYGLALSLRASQRDHGFLSIVVTPGTIVPDHYREVFDEVIDVPWHDAAKNSEWKLENEWKAFHATPYRETIKLDADMLFPTDITPWWDILARQDMWMATEVETYRGDVVDSDFYRKIFTSNDLPNVYTAFTYFKAVPHVQEFFDFCGTIYDNWEKFSWDYLDETRPDTASTDVVFALAAKLMGRIDEVTSSQPIPRFVHMKTRLQGWPDDLSEDWRLHISMAVSNDGQLKIGRYNQVLPVHYQIKEVLTDQLISRYEGMKCKR